jgi:2-methylcitrate dehydratase PrpD
VSVTKAVVDFAHEIAYEDLPESVRHETKRLLLDSIGCAVGGRNTKKGKIAICMASALGGPEEAPLLCSKRAVATASAAYALGELMNALDYEALLFPPDHATPYVLAAPLAVAGGLPLSGKEVMVATAIAHELALRIGAAMKFGERFSVELPHRKITLPLPNPGYGLCILAGAAATARLKKLSSDKIAHAIGIAGYQAPIPMLADFSQVVPAGLAKFLSAGALAQQTVTSVMASEMGLTANPEILDDQSGFWRAFGADSWHPQLIANDLGKTWYFADRLLYKMYPCCGAMQNGLAHLDQLIRTHEIAVDDISEITVKMNLLAELPIWKSPRVENHVDAQFNIPYVFSVMAHQIEPGPAWQSEKTFHDPGIINFMTKVNVITDLDTTVALDHDLSVVTRTESGENRLTGNGMAMDPQMSDDALIEKFKRNTEDYWGRQRALDIANRIMELEFEADTRALFMAMS